MARKYEYMPGRCAWNLEQCEEEIFIAAWIETSNSIPPDRGWAHSLEHYFFELGRGLSFEDLNEFNSLRKSQGLEPITLRKTEICEYARGRDEQMKSQRRKQLREELAMASHEILAERLAQARAEEKRFPPSHITYEEFKLRKLQQNTAPFGQGDAPTRSSPWHHGDGLEPISITARIPPRSEKQANFQRLLPVRTAKLRQAIHGLRNLSSSNYEFDEAEVEKTFATLFELVEEARSAFRRRLARPSRLGR